MLKQISIFAENKKGTMQDITDILMRADINIWGSVTNDSAEYGIVRMVVSDPEKAAAALTDANYICKLTDVLGIEIEDKVGHLNKLLVSLQESNINVNYMYLSFNRDSGKPVMVFHVEEIYEVAECMRGKGYSVL